jgi:phenylacetate-CoA ligase
MNLVAAYFTLRQLQRSQWLDRDSLRRLQEEKLRRLIDHAYRTVPYYRRRFDEAGITPNAIRSLDDLHRIPVTSKADLQHAGPEAITSSACSPDRLVLEHTSGSTGRPFTGRFDPHFVRVRNSLFLRASRVNSCEKRNNRPIAGHRSDGLRDESQDSQASS